jgi:hypothetical protein
MRRTKIIEASDGEKKLTVHVAIEANGSVNDIDRCLHESVDAINDAVRTKFYQLNIKIR